MSATNFDEIFKFLACIGKKQSILIAEDDVEANKIQFNFLSKLYSVVDTTFNGQEAFEQYQINHYDIVITDINMPKMNGLELCKKIREINPSQQIIIVSAYNDFNFMQEAIRIGINEYLLKPLDYNDFLLVLKRISTNVEKEQIYTRQTKLAAIGEITNNIAHQWKQPLCVLSANALSLSAVFELGELTPKHINEFVDSSTTILSHMSQTIDDFKNFAKPDNEKRFFKLTDAIKSACSILKNNFESNDIDVSIPNECAIMVFGYKSQFTHVLLNILNNAQEAVISHRHSDRTIEIELDNEDKHIELLIKDNGGGIDKDIINRIFEPYFTTKSDSGTGIGLYMSKNIIETNMNGQISAENKQDGVVFKITLNKVLF